LELLIADSFGITLVERIRTVGPLCVGIDPSAATLHSWNRDDTVEGLEYFARLVLESVSDVAVAVKPQVAYFERFGSAGFAILERLLEDAREAGLLSIADAKRGDIGSTNTGYAQAWLSDRSPLRADAVTVSPYLGLSSLWPLFETAREFDRGVFVLAATSNEEGRRIQISRTADNTTVETDILRGLRELNASSEGTGSFGAVVGANRDRIEFEIETLSGPYLVPGAGSQGATVGYVERIFSRCPKGTVLVNVARALYADPERSALRSSAQHWRDDLVSALL
jgi:orotidine-5'-phosphate decarboxylase